MIEVRLAKPEESGTIVEWMAQQDPGSLPYVGKNTMVLVAEDGGKLREAMPIQAVFMIESMPRNPENKHRDTVVSLVKLLDGAVSVAKGVEIKEVYFIATTKEIEEQAEHFGFEQIPYPVYCRRVS